ncbi:hypothetical protein [Methylomonas sp. UP202]|uniref:hypothetical protein n=1 Tax=Methylomonas sp. UP202 TaxID=3040943 RepID=UPI00247A975D|nr:hypothetical protein [Methylomonas sp. UP202]WGS83888.1 hypothetical protein QC632_12560 [Methylomonas sp. UP202]
MRHFSEIEAIATERRGGPWGLKAALSDTRHIKLAEVINGPIASVPYDLSPRPPFPAQSARLIDQSINLSAGFQQVGVDIN